MKALCQICNEHYADIDPQELRYPLTGAMFHSPDPAHGYPAPFEASIVWDGKEMTPAHCCPYGRIHRAFVKDDEVLTEFGIVKVTPVGAILRAGDQDEPPADIIDQTIEISDEEAERQARAAINSSGITGIGIMKSETVQQLKEKYPIQPVEMGVEVTIKGDQMSTKHYKTFSCPICSKPFDTERRLQSHIGGKHKRGKK